MAGQRELVTLVSKGLGVSFESVRLMDRMLTLNGLRTPSKRGSGRTPMTYRDATNLILAAAWNRNPNDAVRHVTDYRDLKASKGNPLGETFGEGLEAVLGQAARYPEDFKSDHRAVIITLIGPIPYAFIEVRKYAGAEVDEETGLISFGPWEGQTDKQPVVRRVDLYTPAFLAIAESIADGLRDA